MFCLTDQVGYEGETRVLFNYLSLFDVGALIGFPTTFILLFLQQEAQLEHLKQLKLYFLDDHLIPCDVGKALLHDVAASEKLRYLELDSGAYAFDGFRKDLFAVLENHQGLRNFGISRYPVDLDPKHAWLKELLRRNRYIKVTGTRERLWILQDRDIKGLYAFNCFFFAGRKVSEKSLHPSGNRLWAPPSLIKQ